MPKKIPRREEEEYGDEEITEEEMDYEVGRDERPVQTPPPKFRERPRTIPRPQAPKTFQRYVAFTQQAAEGIADNETKEVIAADIWTALANIIERLERIETSIGSMMEN